MTFDLLETATGESLEGWNTSCPGALPKALPPGSRLLKECFDDLTLTPQVPTIKGPRGSITLYSRYLGGVRVIDEL